MKSILCVLVMCLMIVSGNVYAATTIKLGNGAEVPVDNLSDTDKSDLIRISKKIATKDVSDIDLKNVKPNDIREWTSLISGTIREMCQDLNVAVNDFIKTPAGLGISALIIYKVAGKDIINRLYHMLIVPYWLISTAIILFLAWYFYRPVTIYAKIVQEDKKIIKSEPYRTTRYPWDNKKDGKGAFGAALAIGFALNSIISLLVFFN